jgi:SAM-dependent methyltransferase
MIGQLYEESLAGAAVEIEYGDRRTTPLDSARWHTLRDGDEAMLSRCTGPTLDVGSGPGRLTAELARRGIRALGIDITPYAVQLARRAGGQAICRDIFDHIPHTGRWATALLADGNIGIGGDPDALLRRLRELIRPDGEVIAEVEPPGTLSDVESVRLRRAGVVSPWFGWARVSASDIGAFARRAGFTQATCRNEAQRWFASLH